MELMLEMYEGFEFLKAVSMSLDIFRVVTSCGFVDG